MSNTKSVWESKENLTEAILEDTYRSHDSTDQTGKMMQDLSNTLAVISKHTNI